MLRVIVAHMVAFSSLIFLTLLLLCPTFFTYIVVPVLFFFKFVHLSLSLSISYFHSLSIPLVFPLPIFLSCRPFISFSTHNEQRYKVMDACLCGTSLLIVFLSSSFPPPHSLFPPHLSLYLPIPPSILSTLKLFTYSICMLMHLATAPLLSSPSALQIVHPFALSFSFLLEV